MGRYLRRYWGADYAGIRGVSRGSFAIETAVAVTFCNARQTLGQVPCNKGSMDRKHSAAKWRSSSSCCVTDNSSKHRNFARCRPRFLHDKRRKECKLGLRCQLRADDRCQALEPNRERHSFPSPSARVVRICRTIRFSPATDLAQGVHEPHIPKWLRTIRSEIIYESPVGHDGCRLAGNRRFC